MESEHNRMYAKLTPVVGGKRNEREQKKKIENEWSSNKFFVATIITEHVTFRELKSSTSESSTPFHQENTIFSFQ